MRLTIHFPGVLMLSVVVACAAPSQPAPTPSSPTAMPSPAPSGGLPVAVASRDGVRISISLDRTPIVAGERVWATVVVDNLLPVAVLWQGGGCDFVADVAAALEPPVVSEPGRAWDGLAGRFKRLATPPAQEFPSAPFVDERFVDQGAVACTSDLRINELGPGGQLVMRAAWDGDAGGVLVGERVTTITASFPFMGPKGPGDPFSQPVQPLQVAVDVPVVDRGIRRISPAAAVDAALADARFAGWLASAPADAWQGVGVDRTKAGYDVVLTLLVDGAPVSGRATVDPSTGIVTAFERVALGS